MAKKKERMTETATEPVDKVKVQPGEGAADEFYAEANEEVDQIAKMLIEKYHPHLQQARIRYLFDLSEDIPVKGGKETVAYARKATGLLRLFANADFLIVLHGESWQGKLSEGQKQALLDHEICHCQRDDQGKWIIVPHQIEEFACIVERHGLWRQDVKVFAKAVQMELDLTGGLIESRERIAPTHSSEKPVNSDSAESDA